MNDKKKMLLVLMGFFFLLLITYIVEVPVRVSAAKDAKEYTEKLGYGYNLGNTFDVGLESTMLQEEQAVRQMIANIKSQGYTSIRLPVTWTGHFNQSTYELEQSYIQKIGLVVNYAIKENLAVVLTMYNDSIDWISDASDKKALGSKFEGVWKQIAVYFKDTSNLLSFEAVNAPYFKDQTQEEQLKLLNSLNKKFVTAVRGTGGENTKRVLFLPTLNSAITEETCESMATFYKKLKDPLVAVSVHYFGPWNFSVNAAGETLWTSKTNDAMVGTFTLLDTYLKKNQIPVIMSEYGLYGYAQDKERINHGQVLSYFENFLYQAKKNQISVMLWDTCNIYNWVKNAWKDSDIEALMKMSRTVRSAYCNRDRVYCKVGATVKDITLNMNLQEYSVVSLTVNNIPLMENTDYRMEKNNLILNGQFIEGLLTNELGEVARIQVNFSGGIPWTIKVVRYGELTLESATGTVEGIHIPVTYAGEQLATMEASLEDGTVVGPLNWTSFQEYGYSFSPDYTTGELLLTKEFLSSLPENKKVMLTFSFESGTKKKYTIIRNGTTVKEVNYVEPVVKPITSPTAEPTPSLVPTAEPTLAIVKDTQGSLTIDARMILTILMFVTAVGTCFYWMEYRKKRRHERIAYFEKDDLSSY